MGPFYVNGIILVLKDPNSCSVMDFTMAKFGVAVVGLSSYLFNQDYLPTLKCKVSEYNPILVQKPYTDNDVILFGVNVDLKKPLRPGFYISESRFVAFKYFNFEDFCYNCGLIGHVKETCDQVPKERALNDKSTTPVYDPWLRFELVQRSYETILMKSENDTVLESEKTPYAQFIIEIENKCVHVSHPRIKSETVSTHRLRFPCSYLEAKTGLRSTTSRAYEIIQREISKNKPCCFGKIGDKLDIIGCIVEELKLIQKNEFSGDDKWLTLKLQINHIAKLEPVEYETMLAVANERSCEKLIESKISDMVKRRVEENDQNLFFLPFWENQIRQVLTEVGLGPVMQFLEVSRRAYEAMIEVVQMNMSSRIYHA